MAKGRRRVLLVHAQYAAFMAVVAAVRVLPVRLAFCLGDLAAALFYCLDRRHRRRVITQLLHVEAVSSPAEARSLAWRSFRHLGRAAVEIVKMAQYLQPETVRSHISVTGHPEAVDLFFGSAAGGRAAPAIVVTAHYGNWEIGGLGYTLLTGIPLTSVMRPFDNPLIGRWVGRQRQGAGHLIQNKSGAMRALLGAIKRGESVGIVADQHATRGEGVETVFFGHPARTHASPALLHLHTGIPILVTVLRRRPGNLCFEFICAEPIRFAPTGDKESDVRVLTQRYTTALEELIRQDPVQWLWAHRRWLDLYRGKVKDPSRLGRSGHHAHDAHEEERNLPLCPTNPP